MHFVYLPTITTSKMNTGLNMVAGLCHFVFFRLFAWRNNAKRKVEITKTPREITKRRNNTRQKDEKNECATRNDENRARQDEKTTCDNNA